MSDYTTVARPYAKAVYSLVTETTAADPQNLHAWSDALANLAAVVVNPQLRELLDNPNKSKRQKGEDIIQILAGRLNLQQQNLVRLMAENERLKVMPDVAELFAAARAKAENKIEAELTSAFELSTQQADEITNILKNKLGCDITLSTKVNKNLIGGVVIKAGDTIIDASMKSQLESLALSLGR